MITIARENRDFKHFAEVQTGMPMVCDAPLLLYTGHQIPERV